MRIMKNEYALYKGDDLLSVGTIREIAEEMGIEEKTIRFYGNPTYLKRRKKGKNYRYLIKLEEEEV